MQEENYEVFLNFRGPDTRQGLVDALYHSMKDVGIRVFRDSEGLHTGDHIWELYRHIGACRIYITIFSKTYATSKWCLEELACMVKQERVSSAGKRIMPIFFDVTPDNVKLKQEGGYCGDLTNMVEKYGLEKVERWGAALKYVGGISGKSVGKQGIMAFSRSIAKEVLSFLNQKTLPHYQVEMGDQVEEVVDLLEIESGDVQFLVIHGKPGIGKTTLAKLVYNQLSASFQGCSFLEDIEEASKCYTGAEKWMETKYHNIKVLIVFDDVDEWEQIKKFSSNFNWCASGSRVIITTANESILPFLGSVQFKEFKMREMEHENALELFSWHAFGSRSPPSEEYEILSEEAVDILGCLPLGLEILGSFLHRKPRDIWESTVIELKASDGELRDESMLEMIYASLDAKAQKIFLDIACFFVNKEKTNPMYMWEACLNDRIQVLFDLSLVKIIHDNKLWMHGQLRDFGRKKVRNEGYDYMERSRFWKHRKAFKVLNSRKVKKNAEAICLSNDKSSLACCTLRREEFAGLDKLRFLQLYWSNFRGDLKDLLADLKWLSWHHSPAELQATNFFVRRLAVLDLSRSFITEIWKGWQQMKALKYLKVLNLTGCQNLTKTPKFSKFPALERLILEDCKSLMEIDSSIGDLKALEYLNVKGCDYLDTIPSEVCDLMALKEILIGKDNGSPFEVAEEIGRLQSLVTLEIANVKLTKLPKTIGGLKKLERLSLSGCSGLEEIPDSIGDLESLSKLDISRAEFCKFPDSMGKLAELKVIKMGYSQIRTLPSAIGSLKKLEELHAQHSQLVGEIPPDIGGLSSLKILDLSSTRIHLVPRQICQLSKLEVLGLESCDGISLLPLLPTSMKSLRITSRSLHGVEDLSRLSNLADLVLIGGTHDISRLNDSSFAKSANWIGGLNQLKNLEFGFSSITSLPERFSDFCNLKSLTLCCPDIKDIPQLPSSLSMLSLGNHKVNTDLSNLENLSVLQLYNCQVEELGVHRLTHLVHFFAEECTFNMPITSSLPNTLRIFYLHNSDVLGHKLDLSNLKILKQLEIWDCENLSMIQGLEKLTGMEELIICKCSSITSLKGLAAWKMVKVIELCDCTNLQDTDKDLKNLKSIKRLRILGCKLGIIEVIKDDQDDMRRSRRDRLRIQR